MAISTVESLRTHLQWAIELEHATLAPYLSALYSIKDGTNVESAEVIKSVFIEEMLHMALAANIISVLLLRRFKDGDANVRSVWLCSRNDAIGNVAVMLAAAGVWFTGTAWPDLIVAAIMAGLFLWSATQIVLQARSEWTSTQAGQTARGKHGNKNIDECQRADIKQEAV